jgi:hypothetical protein
MMAAMQRCVKERRYPSKTPQTVHRSPDAHTEQSKAPRSNSDALRKRLANQSFIVGVTADDLEAEIAGRGVTQASPLVLLLPFPDYGRKYRP